MIFSYFKKMLNILDSYEERIQIYKKLLIFINFLLNLEYKYYLIVLMPRLSLVYVTQY
jgi:hypothetical protein